MEDEIKEKLNEAGIEVFGTMYFMPIQIMETLPGEGNWQLEQSYVSAEIAFSGLLNAAITFYFPQKMATHIVEGFLGIDSANITKQQMMDTMKEAANMVIGCFLGKADPEGETALGLPEAVMVDDFSPARIADGAVVVFESEFGYLWMSYVEKD